MATLSVSILTPAANAEVEDSVSATGTVTVQGGVLKQINQVTVRFGEGGQLRPATFTLAGQWGCIGTVAPGAPAGGPLTISVLANVTIKGVGEDDALDGEGAVAVQLKPTPPELTIEAYPSPVTPPTVPYPFAFRGTAHDAASGVAAVRFRIDAGDFAPVDNVSGDWGQWAKTIDLPAGTHQLTVEAADTHGATTAQTRPIIVRRPFTPTEIDQVFAPTTYLRELLDFANRQIAIGDTAAGPTPELLAARFYQPFDRLTAGEVYVEAIRPVPQARIVAEVLRRRIGAPPPAVEQASRAAAYRAIVRELGTSPEELRLARLADAATRRTLAARIGIDAGDPEPAHLSDLTLALDAVSEDQLRGLFGMTPASSADPLPAPEADPLVLAWQRGALRSAWQREDAALRDAPGGALPIIDPDLVQAANFTSQAPANPAFALWTARRSWIAQTATTIDQQAAAQADPAARFDGLLTTFIGSIDLAALAARDRTGENIAAPLASLDLDLDAFRFLVMCREALAAGVALDAEWRDVAAIALQVQKRRHYPQWRAEEHQAGLVLEPGQFAATGAVGQDDLPAWRASPRAVADWQQTLGARAAQERDVAGAYRAALDATEAQTLHALRDAYITTIGQQQAVPEDLDTAAERLSRELFVDLRAHVGATTTRADQALETLQGVLFSTRSGRLPAGTDGGWTLRQASFDAEWQWMGAYDTWRAAMRVFAYPENQLLPSYYVPVAGFLSPTQALLQLVDDLRKAIRVTPESARSLANDYVQRLRGELGAALPPELGAPAFALTEQLSDADLGGRQALVSRLFGSVADPYAVPPYLPEVFWLVPMAVGLRLQEDHHCLAALDWFQTVYAFNLPPAKRKIYRGLALEASISSVFERAPDWLVTELNPHVIARTRNNAYTRFTVLSIVRCFLEYADAQFAGNLPEATALARSLYETALELLDLPDVTPETGPTIPFPANPVWEALRLQARANLAKIHNGLNIAGLPVTSATAGAAPAALPSQYRSAVLIDRAKTLAGMAQQLESAFLNALERSDAEAYSLLQAGHDFQVAQASITLSDLKVADAAIAVTMAGLQQVKAQVEFDHFDTLLRDGLNLWEEGALGAQIAAVALRAAAAASLISPSTVVAPGSALSSLADVASSSSQLLQMQASFERRQEDWQFQKNLADQDLQIGAQQILHAANQQQVALQERNLAGLQLDHAGAVLSFLANKFTNAELFEWMSGVLGRVYAYVLQQATAIAQLAEAQLAFERQEPAQGFVRADYWQEAPQDAADAGSAGAADRQGMTGSARLLQDIVRLDQYAFETERRKLHLTQTLSVAELAPPELQQLRESGVLVLRTPLDLFDREFPGHYLRLLKRVRVSLVALVPPVRGVRAALSASGLSRVVVAGDQFRLVTLARSPEEIAFTSPVNATGLFELEPDSGLLLPFEGMGVDAVWRLELPKAANPFDFQTIADVLLTFEYTALGSADYRQQVLRALDGRFRGDRAFSVRDQFPDAWYELNNPDTVAGDGTPLRAEIAIGRDDFTPHLQQLVVEELTLYCLRAEGFAEELPIATLGFRAPGGQPIAAGPVRTTGGIVGTRRPNGAAWRSLAGQDPVGDWSLILEDNPTVRSWFADGSIQDLVLIMSVGGVAPPWP